MDRLDALDGPVSFLADELGGAEEVSEDQSMPNGSPIKVFCLPWVVSVTADKVVIVDQMLRFFVEADGFKLQLSLVATFSQSIYLFQHYISDTPDEGALACF